jgi:hypothetical protein
MHLNPVEDHKPYFAVASFLCAMVSVPAARLGAAWFAPREDLLGFGGLGVALAVLVLLLAAGLVSGVIGLWRKESPRVLAAIAASFNGAGLLWVAVNMPG